MPFLHSDVIVASDQEDLLLTPGNRAEVLPGDEEEDNEEGVLMMVMVMMGMMVTMVIMVIMGIMVLTFLLQFYCNFIVIQCNIQRLFGLTTL